MQVEWGGFEMDFEQTIFRVRKKTYIQYSFDMAQKECKAIEWSLNKLLNSWKKISILQRSGCRISSHLACRRREGVPEVFAAPSWTRIQDSYWTYQDILVVQLSVYWINFLKLLSGIGHRKGRILSNGDFCYPDLNAHHPNSCFHFPASNCWYPMICPAGKRMRKYTYFR